MARNALPVYGHMRVFKRPVEDTPLSMWLHARGISVTAASYEMGIDGKMLRYICNGQCLPSLVNAFKIDRYTNGGVPPSSWLGTTLGKTAFINQGIDVESLKEQHRKALKAFKQRQRIAKQQREAKKAEGSDEETA